MVSQNSVGGAKKTRSTPNICGQHVRMASVQGIEGAARYRASSRAYGSQITRGGSGGLPRPTYRKREDKKKL